MDKLEFKNHSLSVFMPAYNEEANIAKTLEKVSVVLADLKFKNYEIIVIDDGSKDKTAEIVKEFIKKNPSVRIISHNPNKGYGEAIKTGFYNSKYEFIVFSDSDGQFNYSEITKLFAKIDHADIVTGFRIDRQDSLMRLINGWGWTQISNILFGLNLKDVDCAFKLFRKKVIY